MPDHGQRKIKPYIESVCYKRVGNPNCLIHLPWPRSVVL